MEDDRVVFFRGQQRLFLTKVYQLSGISWEEIASKGGVTRRTLSDWKREKYSMPLKSLHKFLALSGLPFPKNAEVRKSFWWAKRAGSIGGTIQYQKHGTIGDPIKRRNKWLEWWQTNGRFRHDGYFIVKKISYPQMSENLAEFAGIMMGDGAITKRQIAITVHSVDDRDYSLYIRSLIHRLFDVNPAWSLRKNDQ